MEPSTKTDPRKFEFDLPLPERLKQLVNNDYLADVLFKVGQCGELIYAHKAIIAMASEVFFTQFNGRFEESQRNTLTDPIVIEDIEPDTFLELLKYMYCGEIDIQACNLVDLYYCSEKYMLRNLGTMCLDFIYPDIWKTDETKELSVLTVLQHNRRYKFPLVDIHCLKIICNNPLKYFKQEAFLALNQEALELIISQPTMNCLIEHLKQAVEQWEQRNKQIEFQFQLKALQCRKLYFFDKCSYSHSIDTRLTLSVKRNVGLYGIGVYVGVQNEPIANSTVTVSVGIDNFSVEKTISVAIELKIHEIMFERLLINKPCVISARVTKDRQGEFNMFHLKGFCTTDDAMLKINGNGQINCIAYLLYDRLHELCDNGLDYY